MAVNDKIKIADYNDIRNKVISILGAGSGNSGYGQTVRSTAVSVSSTVSVNEWANLYYDIVNCYQHQAGTTPTSRAPSIGESVKFNATTEPNSLYDTYADTIIANKFNIAQFATSNLGSATRSYSYPSTFWTSSISCTVTCTWANAAAARYFFNSGGKIRFTATKSGGAAPNRAQNLSWTNLLNTMSSINGGAGPQFGGATPGTGINPNDGQNYFRLSSTFQQWYSVSASSPYGSNVVRIYARSPNVADNSTGTDQQVQFRFDWIDGYTDPGTSPGDSPNDIDYVDGTFTLLSSALYASGTMQPAGSPAFSVSTPGTSFGSIG